MVTILETNSCVFTIAQRLHNAVLTMFMMDTNHCPVEVKFDQNEISIEQMKKMGTYFIMSMEALLHLFNVTMLLCAGHWGPGLSQGKLLGRDKRRGPEAG